MALIDRFFSGKKTVEQDSSRKKTLPCSLEPDNITVEMLKELIPVRNLDEDHLSSFAVNSQSEVFGKGTRLFQAGQNDSSVLYLLKGTVVVDDEEGQKYDVDAGSTKARFPLASGTKFCATAYAKTDVSILRVSKKIMSTISANGNGNADLEKNFIETPDELADSRLFQLFLAHYRENEMTVPTLPDVSLRLAKAMQSEIKSAAEAANIIQLDPIIASKLVQVANCPLYLAANPITTCQAAVNRIGLLATRNLVVSISMKPAFRCDSPLIKNRIAALWKQSIKISCIAYVLAKITKTINPEEALLAGLISDIGVLPFLQFTADLPGSYYNSDEIDIAIPYLRGPVGSSILQSWRFPDTLVEIPRVAENWYYDGGEALNLNDIVILSRLHYYIGARRLADVPAINLIPACSKLDDGTLSPEYSLKILHNAKDKIDEALRFFTL